MVDRVEGMFWENQAKQKKACSPSPPPSWTLCFCLPHQLPFLPFRLPFLSHIHSDLFPMTTWTGIYPVAFLTPYICFSESRFTSVLRLQCRALIRYCECGRGQGWPTLQAMLCFLLPSPQVEEWGWCCSQDHLFWGPPGSPVCGLHKGP